MDGERSEASVATPVFSGIGRRSALRLLGGIPLLVRAGAVTPEVAALSTLPRLPLLEYRTAAGLMRPVRRRWQWRRRSESILQGFQEVAGSLPGHEKRCALMLQTVSEADCGDYVRRDITYQSEPSCRVPAYLLIPKSALAGRGAPGALCLHQTHAAGRKVVVGLGNSPDDEYGVELVRRGYVCLAPAYPLLADYQPDVKALGWKSGTLKAVWDNVRGLDLLESLPYVRRGRFVAIGHSLGGHNAIYTAVMESRISAVATSCAFDSFSHYMGGDIRGWIQTRYLPAFEGYRGRPAEIPFDFHELIASLAPRAFFANAPKGDTNFRWQSVRQIEEAVRPVYEWYGTPERLKVRHPECAHRFPPELREEAYAFLEKNA